MKLVNYHSVEGRCGEEYKPNSRTQISERSFKVQIKGTDAEHYKKIQRIIHQNIMPINEVYLEGKDALIVNHWMPESAYVFTLVDNCFDNKFFLKFFDYKSPKQNFKLFLNDVINGLVELHKNGLWHGSLNTKTTYFHCQKKGSTRPVIRLAGFSHGSGKKKEMMREDWCALGCMIENIMRGTYFNWTGDDNAFNFIELKDLCRSMKLNKMGLERAENRYKDGEELCFVCKEFVLNHPAMFDYENRSIYILLAYAFLEHNGLLYKITDDDVKFGDTEIDVDPSLVEELINTNAIPCDFQEMEIGLKGLYFVTLERNLLSHVPKPQSHLGLTIGSTDIQIDEYFRARQPKVVLALHKAVQGTQFKFIEPYCPDLDVE